MLNENVTVLKLIRAPEADGSERSAIAGVVVYDIVFKIVRMHESRLEREMG